MTENSTDDAALQAEELENLREKAKKLGVKHHPSAGAEVIRQKIKEFEAAAAAASSGSNSSATNTANSDSPPDPRTPQQIEMQRRMAIRHQAERLVRCRITCMNPAKKEWTGELFTVANRSTPTLKRFVPFGVDWHVPKMMLDAIRAREFQTFVTEKSRNGIDKRTGKLVREFAIEIVDPLTPEELQELARRQALEAGQTV
jgi:hypothetical protein